MVGEEHFGGFMTRKPDEIGADGKPKTWKERMEEIIAKSKREKVSSPRIIGRVFRVHVHETTRHATATAPALWQEMGYIDGANDGTMDSMGTIDSTICQWVLYPLSYGTIGHGG